MGILAQVKSYDAIGMLQKLKQALMRDIKGFYHLGTVAIYPDSMQLLTFFLNKIRKLFQDCDFLDNLIVHFFIKSNKW